MNRSAPRECSRWQHGALLACSLFVVACVENPFSDGSTDQPDAGPSTRLPDGGLSDACAPTTCGAQAKTCGTISDGCGRPLDCGTCAAPMTCGAQVPNECGTGTPQGTTGQTLNVKGRFLYDKCGEQVIIRGIEDFQHTNINEIAKAKSNAIRLVYTMDATELESRLKQATDNKLLVSLIPGNGYMDTSWWGRNDIKAVLLKYEAWLLPHAYGEGAYDKDTDRWLRETKEVISAIRGYGYKFPIEILADGWGQRLDTLLEHGKEVLDFDPEHNVLLGNQMYSLFHPDDATIASVVGSGLPIMLGSCSFRDPKNPSQGWYGAPLDQYKLVWQKTFENKIGSFYWDWGPSVDGMTTDKTYGNWTEQGEALAVTGEYTFAKTAKKTTWMLTGKCAGGGG